MNQYVIKFSKQGHICYLSHLDMLRLFKRAFKRAGIKLSYSKGFNPHPRMGFAQPLSLGYSSISEYLEFATEEDYPAEALKAQLERRMPEGVHIFSCQRTEEQNKSLAARTDSAEYIIGIPMGKTQEKDGPALCGAFLAQKEILVKKRQKKSKAWKDVDIRDKIRLLNFVLEGENLLVTAILDSGRESNLSPELLIGALIDFLDIATDRSDIDVMRTKMNFRN